MLRGNCDSTLPISPSPCQSYSRHSSFQGAYGSNCNGQSPSDHHFVLNLSPRPSSYNFNTAVKLGRIMSHQSPVCSESEVTPRLSSFSSIISNGTPTAKSSAELMKEITTLELEILHLERYLLSLYRTAFEQQLHSMETNDAPTQYTIGSHLQTIIDQACQKVKPDAWISGCDYFGQISPAHCIAGSKDQSHASTPKSSSEKDRNASDFEHRNLADHLGSACIEKSPNGPDSLSEDIIRCISSIYCKLGDPSQSHTGFSVSSTSSLSTSSTFSTRNLSDTWSPHCNEEPAEQCQFEGLKEGRGPYAEMIEVLKICLDDDSFNYAARMLKHVRSLIKNLEKVDPRKMKREEKLAFWINIHNALVMHAYLAYGTNNYARSNSVLKAAYNVGGHCINAYIIQNSILGIGSHHKAPWLQSLLSPGKKSKPGSSRHIYAIEYPEPLVHFALSSGAFSDPAVRIYKAKTIFQDLRLAKEEFIQSSVYIHKETRIYLPKILYYFAKDMALNMPGLLDIVNACLSQVQQKVIRRSVKGKPDKYVYWLSQSSIFRYVIDREVVEGRRSV